MSTPLIIEDRRIDATSGLATDTNSVLEIDESSRPVIVRRCEIIAGNREWGLKLSRVFDATFEACAFSGGSDRAYDQVRGGSVTFRRSTFSNDGQRPIVTSRFNLGKFCDIGIKAGTRDVTFEDCVMNDLLLGDYSIYDQVARPRTRRITLRHCTNPNGGPIIVRGRHADSVIAEVSNVSQLVWPSLVTRVYWSYNRHWGDRRIPANGFALSAEELV